MPQALVRHFMTEAALTVPPDTLLTDVAAQMSEARVSCAVVCAATGTPLGVVTERDLTRAYARDAGGSPDKPVGSAMSQRVFTLTGDASCTDAMRVMGERAIRRIVVVDADNTLAGVITQTDLLRAHSEELEFQKQVLEQRVAERTRELSDLNAHLQSLARVDPLMGIGNRRAMDDELIRLEEHARRYKRSYAVALVDVDHFKKFNDHYGHGAGDDVLKRVAAAIAEDIRAADAVFRYGGEEFLIAFPEVGEEGGAVAAEHVRLAVEKLAIPHQHSPFGQVSVSVGVSGCTGANPAWAPLVQRADEALYEAKRLGRNRVERLRTSQAAA